MAGPKFLRGGEVIKKSPGAVGVWTASEQPSPAAGQRLRSCLRWGTPEPREGVFYPGQAVLNTMTQFLDFISNGAT